MAKKSDQPKSDQNPEGQLQSEKQAQSEKMEKQGSHDEMSTSSAQETSQQESSQQERRQKERPARDKQRRQEKRRDEGHGELMEKVLYINRCSKTVKGGRKMSFSALILVGDGKGKVGYGFAKANELTDAIRRGGELARKNLCSVEMDGTTIPHEVYVKWDGATVFMRPAPEGTGVIAGSKARAILEFAGVKNVMAKSIGSNNPFNLVRAMFKAISQLTNRDKIIQARRAE